MPLSTSTLYICSWHPATSISRVPLEVKFMHLRSLKSTLLCASNQQLRDRVHGSLVYDIRQMPLCKPTTVGVMNALFGYRKDPFIREQELLYRPVGSRMPAIRRISLEVRPVKGCNSALPTGVSKQVLSMIEEVRLTWLLPVHNSSWDVSKANVETGTAGRCGPGEGN